MTFDRERWLARACPRCDGTGVGAMAWTPEAYASAPNILITCEACEGTGLRKDAE